VADEPQDHLGDDEEDDEDLQYVPAGGLGLVVVLRADRNEVKGR
jgi:hypothetical protein